MMLTNPLRRLRAGRGKADGGNDARETRTHELSKVIRHGDPHQLAFQISEIAGDRIYERGGVTVEPEALVVDAGGNLGVSAAHFALQCGAGRVHSFEPVPATFELLSRNLSEIPACTAHPLGLAAEPGTAEMTYYPGGDSVMSGVGTDPARTRELLARAGQNFGLSEEEARAMADDRLAPEKIGCEFTTIAGFIKTESIGQIDLLKIDVEGSEVEVLKGIGDENWPIIRQIAAEVHEEHLLEGMTGVLASRGFRLEVDQEPLLAGTPVRMLYAVR